MKKHLGLNLLFLFLSAGVAIAATPSDTTTTISQLGIGSQLTYVGTSTITMDSTTLRDSAPGQYAFSYNPHASFCTFSSPAGATIETGTVLTVTQEANNFNIFYSYKNFQLDEEYAYFHLKLATVAGQDVWMECGYNAKIFGIDPVLNSLNDLSPGMQFEFSAKPRQVISMLILYVTAGGDYATSCALQATSVSIDSAKCGRIDGDLSVFFDGLFTNLMSCNQRVASGASSSAGSTTTGGGYSYIRDQVTMCSQYGGNYCVLNSPVYQ